MSSSGQAGGLVWSLAPLFSSCPQVSPAFIKHQPGQGGNVRNISIDITNDEVSTRWSELDVILDRLSKMVSQRSFRSITMPSRESIDNIEEDQSAAFALAISNQSNSAEFAVAGKGVGEWLNHEESVIFGADGTNTTCGMITVRVQSRTHQLLFEVIAESGHHGTQSSRREGVLNNEREISSSVAHGSSMRLERGDILQLNRHLAFARCCAWPRK